jgi:hypothetical protein
MKLTDKEKIKYLNEYNVILKREISQLIKLLKTKDKAYFKKMMKLVEEAKKAAEVKESKKYLVLVCCF